MELKKSKKKQKLSKPIRSSLLELQAHQDKISTLAVYETSTLVSASFDHSIKFWDIEMKSNTRTWNSETAVLSLDTLQQSGGLYISGHSDNLLRVWDPRSKESLVHSKFTGHKNWVTDVKWKDAMTFASVSLDGTIKLWDMRSSTHVTSLATQDKLLCMDVNDNLLCAGGEEGKCWIYT
jgi:ribosome biogenesis protein YTM1